MHCSDCGKHLQDDSRFCDGCGAAVAAAPAGASAQPAAPAPQTPPAPEPPAAAPAPASASRRPRTSWLAGGLGAIALVVVGVLLVQGMGGSSAGGSDPVDAVERLAAAANREDPAAALAVVDPREADALSELYGDVRDTVVETGAVRRDGGVAETDVELGQLQLDEEELADGVAKVRIAGGTLDARVEAAGVPAALGLDDTAATQLDLGEIASESRAGLFLIVREHEGRWFVSPELTGLQYLVELEDLPQPDWSALDDPAGDAEAGAGARTGEQLLQRASEVVSARNVSGAIELAAQDEADVLRAYRGSLEALVGRADGQLGVSIASSDVVERDEGEQLVRLELANVQGGVSVESYDDYDSAQFTLNGLCLASDGDDQACDQRMQRIFGITRFFVMAERDGDRLRLAPAATALAYGRLVIDRLGPEGMARVLGVVPQEGGEELKAGEQVTGELSDAGIAVHPYRADGEQFLALETDRSVMVMDPDGKPLESVGCMEESTLFRLPQEGVFHVAVGTFAFRSSSYRVAAQPIEVRELATSGAVAGTIPRFGQMAAYRVRYTGEPVRFKGGSNASATFFGPLHAGGGACFSDRSLLGPEPYLWYDEQDDRLRDDYTPSYGSDAEIYDWYDSGEYLLLISGNPGARYSGELSVW